jgi:zinc transport system permease protein
MGAFYAWLAGLARAGVIPGPFEYPFVTRGAITVLIVAPLLGGLSHLVVARRLAFFSAALGQAALTGLTIGIVLGEPLNSPVAGITGFCLLCAVTMIYVKRRATLPPDTLVGVFMALTLGLGICLLVAVTKRFNIHQIQAVMFGSVLTVTDGDLGVLLLVAIAVAIAIGRIYNALLSDSLSTSMARARGVNTTAAEYIFVMALTFAITVSLKVVGAFLVEAMVVVPAACARNLSRNIAGSVALSVLIALASGFSGLAVSTVWQVPTGGAIVLCLSLCFFVTLALGAATRRLA